MSVLHNIIILMGSIINEENASDVWARKANTATLYCAFKVRVIIALIIVL